MLNDGHWSVLALDALDRLAQVGQGHVECPYEPHDGVPPSAAVAIFEPRDVFDAYADTVGKLLLCESCVVAEPAERQAKRAMVSCVVGLVSGHCKSGGGSLCSADHISAPAPLERPGA